MEWLKLRGFLAEVARRFVSKTFLEDEEMRFRRRRLAGTFSALLLTCGLACSSQQQEEEGLEVSDQGQQAADNQSAPENEAANNNAAGEEGANETYNEQEGGENNESEGGDESADAGEGDATENDLQNIIQEMNGQQAATSNPIGEAPVDPAALAQNVAIPAPADTSVPAVPEAPATEAPESQPAAGSINPIPFQPGGTPAGQGLPEMGSKMAYIVQKGDTLGKISSKIYGSPARWNEIAKLSGMQNPNRIYAGDVVFYTLDESATAFATAYEQAQRSEEQVQPGDTLATIAQRVYGSTAAWRSIWRQNDKIDNPDIVPPGTTIFYLTEQQLSAAVKKAKSQLNPVQQTKIGDDLATTKKLKAHQNAQSVDSLKSEVSKNLVHGSEVFTRNGIQIATDKLTNGVLAHINLSADLG